MKNLRYLIVAGLLLLCGTPFLIGPFVWLDHHGYVNDSILGSTDPLLISLDEVAQKSEITANLYDSYLKLWLGSDLQLELYKTAKIIKMKIIDGTLKGEISCSYPESANSTDPD